MPDVPHSPLSSRWSRRDFLKSMGLLGASLLPACRRAEEYLVPFRTGAEWSVPGDSEAFATCLPHAGGALPVVVLCREGCPVLLQPNPAYPGRSGISAGDQASLLSLYDPARCRETRFHGRRADPDEFNGAFAAWAQQCAGGGKTGFLFGGAPSAARDALVEELRRRNPQVRVFAHDAFTTGNLRAALDRRVAPGAVMRCALSEAQAILALDCDFLGDSPVGPCASFAARRTPEGGDYAQSPGRYDKLVWLAAAEESPSLTGGMADCLISCPGGMEAFVSEIARALLDLAREDELSREFGFPSVSVRREVEVCARRLWDCRGGALILAGEHLSAAVHEVVLSLNTLLQAPGGTLRFLQGLAHAGGTLADLTKALEADEIETLFLFAPGDPAAEDAAFGEALRRSTAESVRFCLYEDETARAASWSLPATHPLEEWGLDYDPEGRLCIRQPVTAPLCGGVSELEVLIGLLSGRGALAAAADSPNQLSPAFTRVRRVFDQLSKKAARLRDQAWKELQQNGFTAHGYPLLHRAPAVIFPELPERASPAGGVPLSLRPDAVFKSPADHCNAWLRELYNPLTGVAGEVVARASLPGLPDGALRLLRLRREGLPALELPVIGDAMERAAAGGDHITLPLVCGGGLNTFPWISVKSAAPEDILLLPLDRSVVRSPIARVTPGSEPEILRTAEPSARSGEPPVVDSRACPDPRHQWGMSIDLNLCLGCNACLVACRAENNIPVVGVEELRRGRDLQWIRIDRYLCQDMRRVSVPVACQQCEAAPCESVCPVNAAVHTEDGLSAMVYPRCWGTRYCAANCPYGARKFNFFDYASASARETRRKVNPRVTVRSRGVMEKCSYCVQRIREALYRHKRDKALSALGSSRESEWSGDDLVLPEDAVQTACQRACPTGAISFGNLLPTKESTRVFRAQSSPRAVRLLEELGTRPRTVYLRRVPPPPARSAASGETARRKGENGWAADGR